MTKSHVNKLLISKFEISAIDMVPTDKSCAFDFVMQFGLMKEFLTWPSSRSQLSCTYHILKVM